MRVLLAFLIAPSSFGILLFCLSIFTSSISEGMWVLKFVAIIGYPLAILLGIPAYFLLQRFGANGLFVYSVMSLVFAAILDTYFIVLPVFFEHEGDLSSLFSGTRIAQMVMLTFASFFTVLVFWLIARPDKVVRSF